VVTSCCLSVAFLFIYLQKEAYLLILDKIKKKLTNSVVNFMKLEEGGRILD
jgi:hypothetical protein